MEKARDGAALATITMRLREPLRAQIEASAKAKGTSMNSEMVERLNRSFMFDQLLGE